MAVPVLETWGELDPQTRRSLDERYLAELADFAGPELTDAGVQAYLDYRHERPGAGITTYEEGQIRKLVRRFRDPSKLPDPVALEEHSDPLEVIGARWFHLTNSKTYVAIMLTLTFAFILALFFMVL